MIRKINYKTIYLILFFCLIFTVILGISLGPIRIEFGEIVKIIYGKLADESMLNDVKKSTINIVWELRVPRVLCGLFVGVNLTLSGVAMQSFTSNPLADPYILGTSSGASFGAVLGLVLSANTKIVPFATTLFAFVGSLLAILIVYLISNDEKRVSPVKMVLVGTAVSALFSALTNFAVYKSKDQNTVRQVSFWMLGSLASQEWSNLPVLVAVSMVGVLILYFQKNGLNAVLMGDNAATTLGIDVNSVRNKTIIASALMTGVSVATAGSIGFVGLIVPHVIRAVFGADHQRVIPISIFLGGMFIILVDIGARLIDSPGEMPLGIITSMLGAPFFLYLMKKKKYTFNNR